jgi:hypothetical protein
MHGTSSASSMILATALGHLVPSSPANASIAQGGSGRASGSGDSTPRIFQMDGPRLSGLEAASEDTRRAETTFPAPWLDRSAAPS